MTILSEAIERTKQLGIEKRKMYKNRAARRPELGSWHTITEKAEKFRDGDSVHWQAVDIEDEDSRLGTMTYADHKKLYNEGKSIPSPIAITSYRAMYIGYRFKFNGKWEETRMDYDEGYENYFSQSETVEVWMFVTHANRNPVAVFPFEISAT